MRKYLALSVVCLLYPVQAQAQDELIKDFSPAQVEKFIKDVMKADVKKTVNDKTKVIYYSTPDGQFDIYYTTGPKKSVIFVYDYAKLKTTPEKINQWNYELGLTRACTGPRGLSLMAGLNVESGLTWRQFTDFYDQIQSTRTAFEQFVK